MDIKVKENFEIVDFATMVDSIVAEYFDAEGNYTPHIGMLNAMRVFYNECVTESKFDIEHNIVEALEMETLVADDDFIEAFNKAIYFDGTVKLNFANAYKNALDIVNTRKTSIGNAIDMFKSGLTKFVDKISPVLTEGNLAQLTKIAEDISKGKLNPDSIVEAYGNSKRIEEIANKK